MDFLSDYEKRLQKVLKYDEMIYTPSYVKNALSTGSASEIKALRKEYSRLRSIAEKRLARLKASEFVKSEIIKEFEGSFPTLKEMDANNDIFGLAYGLADARRFLGRKASTVSGQREIRKKLLESFHRHGYSEVDELNLDEYVAILEGYREAHIRYSFGNIAYIISLRNDVLKENPKKITDKDLDAAIYHLAKLEGSADKTQEYFAYKRYLRKKKERR